jgi:polar amino acid transport system substrate-binding protein
MTAGIAEYSLMSRFPKGTLEKVTFHKKPIKEYDSFIYFPQALANSLLLLERFNQGLKQLKISGQYQQILSNYRNGHYAMSPDDNKE